MISYWTIWNHMFQGPSMPEQAVISDCAHGAMNMFSSLRLINVLFLLGNYSDLFDWNQWTKSHLTWHQATLEAGRTVTTASAYRGGLVVRRRRWTGPTSLWRRYQPARLTRTTTVPTTVRICLSNRPLTSHESWCNRVISGAEVRIVDQCLTDSSLNVTFKLRALFAVAQIITQHRFGPYWRDDQGVKRALSQLQIVDAEYNTWYTYIIKWTGSRHCDSIDFLKSVASDFGRSFLSLVTSTSKLCHGLRTLRHALMPLWFIIYRTRRPGWPLTCWESLRVLWL